MTFKIAIVPAGAWGTALALPASAGGHDVVLWRDQAFDPGFPNGWDHGHPALRGLRLPDNVRGVADMEAAVRGADVIISASASAGLRNYCRQMRPLLKPEAMILSVTKGIEPETGLRMTEILTQELPEHATRIAALSGPNFSTEVAAGLPTTTVVACADVAVAEIAQDALMGPKFRVYTNPDMLGVELAGALKNVMALAAGLSDGLNMGDNARAALITRGLTEIARLGTAMGANILTFAGLAGMGDLVLTCTGDTSRNRQAGLAIGRGQSAEEFVSKTHLTVEGIPTTRAAWLLAQKLTVRMPITEQLYRVLYEGLSPLEGVRNLMEREKTYEVEEVLRQSFTVPDPKL
ncbi:MAG TPA: NAD(P)H-dependent glycerol-3-phosphate dehydrogenase [Symbiobacteriaceae bacterium]